MAEHYTTRSTIPEERLYVIRILGTGAADPTLEIGQGVSVTEEATGNYRVTFSKNPGKFIGIRGYAFGGATPADVKGYTLTRDTYTAPTTTADGFLDLWVWDSSFAAADLAATQYLDVTIAFSESSEAA